MTTPQTLVGMFFIRNDGDHFYTGEVVAQISPAVYLIQHEALEVPGPLELFDLAEMVGEDEGVRDWGFFRTQEERKVWMEWVRSPAGSNVVTLVKS